MARSRGPLLGYSLAALNMVISGVAIYVNSIGVKLFSDSTLYTAGKNLVTGVALLIAMASSGRGVFSALRGRDWALLGVVAVIGGSVSYALYFRGLEISTPVTASLIDHTQFLFVALLAAAFLRERWSASIWAALVVLLAGLVIGVAASSARLDAGVPFIAAATLLFAVDFIVMKILLRTVAPLTVMTFKMGAGSLLLFLLVSLSGHAGMIARLSSPADQLSCRHRPHPSCLHRHLGARPSVGFGHGNHSHTRRLPHHHNRSGRLVAERPDPRRPMARVLPGAPCRACHLHPGVPAGDEESQRDFEWGGRMNDGLLLFARYAFAPNRLGYCGPSDHGALFGYLTEDKTDAGLRELAQKFEGAFPYLRLIAEASGLSDPFDARVVEAYWIGNRHLERVEASPFYESLKERFRPRMGDHELSWMTAGLEDGARPHHNFHVFEIYRRAGLLRDARANIALERMDQCRISWGSVEAVEGAEVIVRRSPLVIEAGALRFGPAGPARVLRQIDSRGYLDDLRPGDVVSIHWNWACDRLGPGALRELMRCTRRAIAHTNLTM